MLTFMRTYGVHVSGWIYNLGTVVLLVAGGAQGSWLQQSAAVMFLSSGYVFGRYGCYWLGYLIRLGGLTYLFASLQWNAITGLAATIAMTACVIGALEPFITRPIRVTVFCLMTASRAPYLVAVWGEPWLVVSVLIWVVGDIYQGLSRS